MTLTQLTRRSSTIDGIVSALTASGGAYTDMYTVRVRKALETLVSKRYVGWTWAVADNTTGKLSDDSVVITALPGVLERLRAEDCDDGCCPTSNRQGESKHATIS